ncbi:hypothetical protein [Calothrix sp. 336/3]|uniref:hypothetical protein n=1 Tax=Calothrix sp. 336/3 TaxID=1337936 RepID=UPI0004E306A0|nr:hypothetical protein [Calothrix sp. 336/3]AKG23582.1 hypothetical protein IJ00_21900 [Calothrix sp. 336/3]
MSSGDSGRYQSRLFNFFYHQSRRLGDGAKRTLRQLQLATSWSIEALVYPIYIMMQNVVESADKQLSSGTSAENKALPATDEPIQQVLQEIENLSIHPSEGLVVSNSTSSSLNFQGIAAEIDSHQLVLINSENEIVDILSQEQQQQLENKIISEIGKYWRQLQPAKAESKLLPEIDKLLTKILYGKQEENSQPDATALVFVDNAVRKVSNLQIISKLESHAIIPITRTSQEIVKIAQDKLHLFLYGEQSEVNHNPSKISGLILAAINFFFGEKTTSQLPQNSHIPSPSKRISPRSPQIKETAIDPWLTFDDLFGEAAAVYQTIDESQTDRQLVGNQSQSLQLESTSDIVVAQSTTITQDNSPTPSDIKAQPDWIETQAKTVSYEKHPLERLLEWVDSFMVVLEEISVQLWQILKRLLTRIIR